MMPTRRCRPTPEDEQFMELAISLAGESIQEDRQDGRASPKVGVVAVKNGQVLCTAHRGLGGPGDHAEWSLIKGLGDAAGRVLGVATIYTTLEPCTTRSAGKTPCADHLINMGVSRVFIGVYDPHPRVHRLGWKRLRDAGIELCDFTPMLRARADGLLEAFRGPYAVGALTARQATFDFSQNGGRYPIEVDSTRFETRWTVCGDDSVYTLFREGDLALAKHAQNFDQIDDPAAYHFASHSERVAVGEIAILREGDDFLLVQVVEVVPGPSRGTEYASLTIEWEPRLAGLDD